MKKIYSTLVVLCLAITTFGQNAEIEFFEGSLDELKAHAKKKGKPFFVDTYTDWCGYCKKMDATTFRDAKVVEYVKGHYIGYKINAEKGEGPSFARTHNVSGFPTVVVFDANGKLVSKITGYANADRFLSSLQKLEKTMPKVKAQESSKSLDETSFDDWLLAKQQFTDELAQNVSREKGHAWVSFEQRAFEYGKKRSMFDYEELVIEARRSYADKITPGLEIEFTRGKGDEEKARALLNEQLEKGGLTPDELHLIVLKALSTKEIELDHLKWINWVTIKQKDNVEALDTKAAVQLIYGDTNDGLETAKRAKKIASKTKKDAASIDLLIAITK